MHLLYERTIVQYGHGLQYRFIFAELKLLPGRNFEFFYLLSECILLFNSQHVHPHPVNTITSTITSRPTTIPSAVIAISQFILVSLIDGLVSNMVVVDDCFSFVTIFGDVWTVVVVWIIIIIGKCNQWHACMSFEPNDFTIELTCIWSIPLVTVVVGWVDV